MLDMIIFGAMFWAGGKIAQAQRSGIEEQCVAREKQCAQNIELQHLRAELEELKKRST